MIARILFFTLMLVMAFTYAMYAVLFIIYPSEQAQGESHHLSTTASSSSTTSSSPLPPHIQFQLKRKSMYYTGLDMFSNKAVNLVNSSDLLIPTALSIIHSKPPNPLLDAIPPPPTDNYSIFDSLPRLSSLADISRHPDEFVIVALDPLLPHDQDSRIPPHRYSNPPHYYEIRTCRASLYSEFMHLLEEGMRCAHDINSDEPDPNWPGDDSRFHHPSLVITRNAEITERGYVRKGNFMVVPNEACFVWSGAGQYVKPEFAPLDTRLWMGEYVDIIPQRIFVDKPVITITQYWKVMIWHTIGESFGRLAPHIKTLVDNADILIHLAMTDRMKPHVKIALKCLEFFGIGEDRVVEGNVLAPIVMMPEPTVLCCLTSHYQTLALHQLILDRLGNYYYPEMLGNTVDYRYKDYILVAKRTLAKDRRITNFDGMMVALQSELPEETFVLFDDADMPSLAESFWMFRNAKMIIAGHGASQSNIIACRKGTVLIEFLTNDYLIQVAYGLIAQQLGMQYHAWAPMISSKQGDFTVEIDLLIKIVKKSLK